MEPRRRRIERIRKWQEMRARKKELAQLEADLVVKRRELAEARRAATAAGIADKPLPVCIETLAYEFKKSVIENFRKYQDEVRARLQSAGVHVPH